MPTVKGQAETKRFMTRLPEELVKVLRGAGRAGANVIADEIKGNTPSEAVRDGLRIRSRVKDGRILVKVDIKPGWGRSVGIWLEWGTDPHFISVDDSQRNGMSVGRINRLAKEPDAGHSLVIGDKFVGKTVFHPGARPHPTFRPALDTKEAEAIAAAQGYIRARITRAGIVGGGVEGDDE